MTDKEEKRLVIGKVSLRALKFKEMLEDAGLRGLAYGISASKRVILEEIDIPGIGTKCVLDGRRGGFYVQSHPEVKGRGYGPLCEDCAKFVIDLVARKI